jgi:hypothetical protein
MQSTWSVNDNLNINALDLIFNDDLLKPAFLLIYSRHLSDIHGDELVAMQIDASLPNLYQPPTSQISSPFGLRYLQAYYINRELLIFANEGTARITNTVAIRVKLGGTPELIRLDEKAGPGFDYNTLTLQPFESGYIMVCISTSLSNNGGLYLLYFDLDLSFSGTTNTKLQGVTYAKLIPSFQTFYLFAYNGQGGNMFLLKSGLVTGLQTISGFDNWKTISSIFHLDFAANKHLLVGTTNRGISTATLNYQQLINTATYGGTANGNESNPILLYENDILTIVANTNSASIHRADGDVVRNFGMSDVWIIRLR